MEKWKRHTYRRVGAIVAVSVASLVVFASLGGVGLAQSAVGLTQYQYGHKVTICHKGMRTIRISVRAWPAHQRHGDVIGICARRHAKRHHEKQRMMKQQHEKQHSGMLNAGKEHGNTGKLEAGQAGTQAVTGSEGHGKRDHGNGKANGRDK